MHKRRSILLAAFLLLFILVPLVSAQDITPLEYGDSVSGQITDPETGILYSFSGRAGDQVVIEVNGEGVDVYVRLGNAQGEVLAENDDISSSNLDARLEFTLPEDGDYLIAALAYETGRYTLNLSNAAQPAPSGGNTLSYGDTASGEAVDLETPVVFTFEGSAGETVAITTASDTVDTYLVLADSSGNSLAENDDISQDNLNAYIEAVLPGNGTYLIGVYGYSSGPFTLSLESGSGGEAPAQPVVSTGGGDGEIFTGTISDSEYYLSFPLDGVQEGQTITIDARATAGDLDLYLGLFLGDQVVAENDDRDQGDINPLIEYPRAEAGDYTVVVTRYGFGEGQTTGDFELSIKVSAGGGGLVASTGGAVNVNPVASGYPTIQPTSSVADWTVLVYMGADNNLEPNLVNDLDEFEVAGGSDGDVRVLALLDRSGEFDNSNGNWTETRLFEVAADRTRDQGRAFPATIDSNAIVELGELDTSHGPNLTDFLVWGIQSYPAQHYAIILNDHGGAWYGTVGDDTTGHGLLTIPEMSQVFSSVQESTGVQKFDLLVNDACLMSSVEHYAEMSKYFDFAIGSPEITMAAGFDMTVFLETLRSNPDMDMSRLGQTVADDYLSDMARDTPDMVPVLTAAATDLRNFQVVTDAVNAFADIIIDDPQRYASLIGQIRTNTYAYSFFIPEAQAGPASNIDVGHFMANVIGANADAQLTSAAQNVLQALGQVNLYGTAGNQVQRFTSYYNIYFPPRIDALDPQYFEQSPLQSWAQMIRLLFGAISPNARSFRGVTAETPAGAPVAEAPSLVPQVNITLVFPTVTSVAYPIKVSMEVTGRNISYGDFTVDQIQPDGSSIRLETSRIVTEVVEDGVVDFVNLWHPGVDDSDFTWDVELPQVSDGQISSFEQVVTRDDVSSIAGRYQYPGSSEWVDVTVIFNDDGGTSDVVGQLADSAALATVQVEPGGTFQVYRSRVTPDGRVVSELGTTFNWPEGGLTWDYAPAPTGQYNLGFLVEAFGGATGFNSTTITVNNDDINPDLRGYIDDDWGFVFQRPADWFSVSYFPDSDFLQTSDLDATEYLFVYPVYESDGDLQAIADAVLERFDLTADGGFTPTTAGGQDALEFEFTYSNDSGTFASRAFAVYVDYLSLGLVFSSEALDAKAMQRNYETLIGSLEFFNAEEVEAQDSGFWTSDIYTDITRYPVPENWMPGAQNGLWWFYTPDNVAESDTVAAVTVLNPMDGAAADILQTLLDEEIAGKPGFSLGGTETYYGENNTWEVAFFTHDGLNGGAITGQMYVTVKDGIPYVLWFEAPTAEFGERFRQVFTVMLDGFRIDDAEDAS
jgi:hypothetical protein